MNCYQSETQKNIWSEESKKQKTELLKNVGRRCKVIESPIAGLTGKEATIMDVVGELPHGFRYEIKLDEPLYTFTNNKLDYYPPTFLVKVL